MNLPIGSESIGSWQINWDYIPNPKKLTRAIKRQHSESPAIAPFERKSQQNRQKRTHYRTYAYTYLSIPR